MVSNGDFHTTLPCIASHEGAGVVIATGSSVPDSSFKKGDKIMAGIPFHGCGACKDCLSPDTQFCTKINHCGVTRDGFFAEYAIADARNSTRMPESIKYEAAAPLACAGRTIFKGIKMADCRAGEWLAIVGSGGGLGHLGIQFAKATGAQVIGVDAKDGGLKLSREAGADIVLDARQGIEKVVEEVKKVTGGEGVKASVNVSDAPTAAALACGITMMHGLMIQVAQVSNLSRPS